MLMILPRNAWIISGGIVTRKPASTMRSSFFSMSLRVIAVLNAALSGNCFGDMHSASTPAFSALFRA